MLELIWSARYRLAITGLAGAKQCDSITTPVFVASLLRARCFILFVDGWQRHP